MSEQYTDEELQRNYSVRVTTNFMQQAASDRLDTDSETTIKYYNAPSSPAVTRPSLITGYSPSESTQARIVEIITI